MNESNQIEADRNGSKRPNTKNFINFKEKRLLKEEKNQPPNIHSHSHNNRFEKIKEKVKEDKQRIQGCLNLFYNFQFLNLNQCVVGGGFIFFSFFHKIISIKTASHFQDKEYHIFNSICHLYRKNVKQQMECDEWVLGIGCWSNSVAYFIVRTLNADH